MTKTHANFFVLEAKDNFHLGTLMGEKFGESTRKSIEESSKKPNWRERTDRAEKYLVLTEKYFPNYVAEMRGYAEGSKVEFLNLWALSLEDEVSDMPLGKCTTIATNRGKLISHNEDWAKDSENNICLLLKKIGKTIILELYYFNTLGGNAVSINSHGFIVSVNTLTHDRKFGIPRNVVARAMSETTDPENDFQKLKNLPRGLSSNFNIFNQDGKIWNIETGGNDASVVLPSTPYVHTNHYLGELKFLEKSDNWDGTFDRYEVAQAKIKDKMTTEEMITLSSDQSRGEKVSIMNERTIAKMIVDLEKSVVHVWMRREKEKGWIPYDLKELKIL